MGVKHNGPERSILVMSEELGGVKEVYTACGDVGSYLGWSDVDQGQHGMLGGLKNPET